MLELFSHYVLHFERYFILSRQSTLLIQWSIVVLAGLYLLVHHPKINRQRTMFLAGVILRIVLLAGVSVELIHQVQSTNFTSAYLREDGKNCRRCCIFVIRICAADGFSLYADAA